MLYYSIVIVSIGSLSTGSPSVSSFSSGECGNAILQYCYGFNRRQLWLSLLTQGLLQSVPSLQVSACMHSPEEKELTEGDPVLREPIETITIL